jgi:hypothetical protein
MSHDVTELLEFIHDASIDKLIRLLEAVILRAEELQLDTTGFRNNLSRAKSIRAQITPSGDDSVHEVRV